MKDVCQILVENWVKIKRSMQCCTSVTIFHCNVKLFIQFMYNLDVKNPFDINVNTI